MSGFPKLCAVCGEAGTDKTVTMTDSTGISYALHLHSADCYQAHLDYQRKIR